MYAGFQHFMIVLYIYEIFEHVGAPYNHSIVTKFLQLMLNIGYYVTY